MSKQLNVRAIPEETFQRFKKLCQQEGEDMSDKIRSWMDNYVREHWPGNPQTPLSRFIERQTTKRICLEGEKGLCPQRPDLCALRHRYVCKF